MKKAIFLLLISLTCFSQAKISYKKSDGLLDITPYIAYMADSSEKMTFEQVRSLPASAFKFNNKVGLNLGNTQIPYWFKMDIQNTKLNEDLYFLVDFSVRILDVYILNEDKSIKKWGSGLYRPFLGQYFNTNKQIFNIGQNPKTLFFRVKSTTLYLPTYLGTIQPLYVFSHKFDLFMGGFYGIILAIALYNLFLFFSLKDRIFLYYSLFSFSVFYANFAGFGFHHEFLFPNNKFMADFNNGPSLIVLLLAVFFISQFLNTKFYSPKLHKLLIGIFILAILILIQNLVLPYSGIFNSFIHFFVIFTSFSVLFISSYIWYLGYQPAKYLTIAWVLFLLGNTIRLLGFSNIIPNDNFWVLSSTQIGTTFEALLMAFAVAYRFNLFRQEARDAQALVLQRSGENEQLLLAHNQILEEKLQLEEKISNQKPNLKVDDLLERLQSERGKNKKLAVSTIEGVLLLPIPDIIRLEALGSYCNIYLTNNKKIIASKNLAEFEPMLDKTDFIRIHKSHIVNINFVERYIRGEGGMVIMPDGAEVSVSRTMKAELLERLNIQ